MALSREENQIAIRELGGGSRISQEQLIARFAPASYDTEPMENAVGFAFIGVILGFMLGTAPALIWSLVWPRWLLTGLAGALLGAVIGWWAGYRRRA